MLCAACRLWTLLVVLLVLLLLVLLCRRQRLGRAVPPLQLVPRRRHAAATLFV